MILNVLPLKLECKLIINSIQILIIFKYSRSELSNNPEILIADYKELRKKIEKLQYSINGKTNIMINI